MKINFSKRDNVFIVVPTHKQKISIKKGIVDKIVVEIDEANVLPSMEFATVTVFDEEGNNSYTVPGVNIFTTEEEATAAKYYVMGSLPSDDYNAGAVSHACCKFREKVG